MVKWYKGSLHVQIQGLKGQKWIIWYLVLKDEKTDLQQQLTLLQTVAIMHLVSVIISSNLVVTCLLYFTTKGDLISWWKT